MWMAHFAPGLVLKRWAPDIPLAFLALAGALPDALFMFNAILGIESFKYADKAQDASYTNPTGGRGSGCFPYDADYPYTHSVTGEIVISFIFAVLVSIFYASRSSRFSPQSFVALVAAGLTHPILDLASHRHDIALTTSEPVPQRHGFPLFDYPVVAFAVDLSIFLAGLYLHGTNARPAGTNEHRRQSALAYVIAALTSTAIQLDFNFLGAPTTFARTLHAPTFLFEILAISWGLGLLDVASRGAGKKGLNQAKAGKAL